MADQSAMKRWILTHMTRVWTALFTLAALGASFVYKPEFLTLYLWTTMTAIETGTAALPYLRESGTDLSRRRRPNHAELK
jgi:hypothetical protein